MDYSKMSDFEINMSVALALGAKEVVPGIFMDDNRRYEFEKPRGKAGNKFFFDPCNNPADAWPIIKEFGIGIIPYKKGQSEAWRVSHGLINGTTKDANPLRAAMIVFLQMQESSNVQDNPED